MKGVFGLRTAPELLAKLECEYDQLSGDPDNAYYAYNFFVTAWHLLEWAYPGSTNASVRKAKRDQNPLLQICEHIAVGAKHVEPTHPKHDSVTDSSKGSVWGKGVWAATAWKKGVWATWLTVELSGDAQKAYGKVVKAHDIAAKVMDFWRAEIK